MMKTMMMTTNLMTMTMQDNADKDNDDKDNSAKHNDDDSDDVVDDKMDLDSNSHPSAAATLQPRRESYSKVTNLTLTIEALGETIL